MGKWYAGIYKMKKYSKLFIGRQKWKHWSCRCLKPKVGTGIVLEGTPDHLTDIGMFKVYDVIAGPLEVIPLKGKNRYP